MLLEKWRFGFAGNPFVSELPPSIALRLGGPLDAVIESLGDLGPLLEESKLFATS